MTKPHVYQEQGVQWQSRGSPARTSVTFYPYLTGTVRLWTLQTFPESHGKRGDSRRKSVDLDRSTSVPAFQRPGFREQEHQQLRAVHRHLVRRAEEKTTGGLGANSSNLSRKSELWVLLDSNEHKNNQEVMWHQLHSWREASGCTEHQHGRLSD